MFLIPVSDNLTAEKCTDTIDKHVASVISYPYYIVFDRDTLFMSDHFKDWAGRKGIKLEPSTAYHPQTYGHQKLPTRQSSKPHEHARSKEMIGYTNSPRFRSS